MEEREVTLFRAVTEEEWMNIQRAASFSVPTGRDGKYFYPTREQALAFIATGWATRLTSASFPLAALAGALELIVAGEGRALYLPARLFPHGPVVEEDLEYDSDEVSRT